MVQDMKIQQFAYYGLDLMHTGIAEFYYFMAIGADHVVVLAVAVRFFVLRQVFSKLMFAYQVVFYQKIQGIINCSPAYLIVFILHTDVQRFYIEMTAAGIDLFQNS